MWFLNLIKSQFVSIRQCLTTSANSAIHNAEPKANSQQIHLFDCFCDLPGFGFEMFGLKPAKVKCRRCGDDLTEVGVGATNNPKEHSERNYSLCRRRRRRCTEQKKSLAWGRLEAVCHHMLMIYLVLCW